MDVSRRLLENFEILANIFQYLNLEKQMECANICETFDFVITKLVWPKTYRNLQIYKTPMIGIITRSTPICRCRNELGNLQKICEYKTALKYDKCRAFLKQIAKCVQNLSIYSEYLSLQKNMGVAFRNIQMYTNLRQLSYNQTVVTDQQLLLIAQHCLKLQKLEFIECISDELEPLIPVYNLDICIFAGMPQLRELIFQCESGTSSMTAMQCDIVHEMLTNLNLKCLILNNIRIFDKGENFVGVSNPVSVEILNLGQISMEYWPKFKCQLKEYRNLGELTINVLDCNTLLDSAVFELLAQHCRKLLKLSLENCDLAIDDFGVLKSLRELSLHSCGGLTEHNLQQILSSLSLKRFSIINTRVFSEPAVIKVSPTLEGINVDNRYSPVIKVSPILEEINVDTIYPTKTLEALKKAPIILENVYIVRWFSGNIKDNWLAEKCPNLRVLHVPNPYQIRGCILQMDSLQELSFTSCQHLCWSFFLILIKNLPLKLLNVQTMDTISLKAEEKIPQNAHRISTTLEKIVIPYHIYMAGQNFWMDLLCKHHRHLKILFYGEYGLILNKNLLSNLQKFPYVRHHLKYLKMCGFAIDIHDIQKNTEDILSQLHRKTNHYISKNSKFTIEI